MRDDLVRSRYFDVDMHVELMNSEVVVAQTYEIDLSCEWNART